MAILAAVRFVYPPQERVAAGADTGLDMGGGYSRWVNPHAWNPICKVRFILSIRLIRFGVIILIQLFPFDSRWLQLITWSVSIGFNWLSFGIQLVSSLQGGWGTPRGAWLGLAWGE